MYNEEEAVRDFLSGEYSSVSSLTLGSEMTAKLHEEAGFPDLAAIHRLHIDDGRRILTYLCGLAPAKLREAWLDTTGFPMPGQ